MAQKFLQTQPFYLAGSGVSLSATSIVLRSFAFPDGTLITSAYLGTTNYATLAPGTVKEEIISFTGVTQNVDGTATLTGVTRGLQFGTPYTSDSGLRQTHAGGTELVVSNNPQVYDDMSSNANDESITGTWTFSSSAIPLLDVYTAPTDDKEFASKKYVDDVASGGSASIDRIVPSATAGETISAGQLVYFDETDNEWKKASATTSATCDNVVLGIAQGAGTNGNPILGGVILFGRDSNQSGFTQGDRLYVSDTAGAISASAGTVEVEIGHANSATTIDFTPKFASYTTKAQRDALVGTSGTPSSSNKYVTNDDTSATAVANKVVRADGSNKIAEGYLNISNANVSTLTGGGNADILHIHDLESLTHSSYAAGDNLIAEANTEQTTTSTSYTKVKEIEIHTAGTFRFKFDLKVVGGGGTAYGRVYKNGSPVGVEKTEAGAVYATKTDDVTGFSSGDLLQLYIKHSNGLDSTAVENFKVYMGGFELGTVNMD